MSNSAIGRVGWIDLTVEDAARARDFYRDVLDLEVSEVAMGDYADYCLHPSGEEPVAGVCHARGSNAGLPPVWLVYFVVADLDRAIDRCRARGGELVSGPREMGAQGRYAVIRDVAGAPSALFEAPRG